MFHARVHRLSLVVAVLAVALASVVFAARLAPAAPEGADLQGYLAMGGSLADLCADEPPHHAHHCPVCNLLPEVPEIALRTAALRIDHRFHVGTLRDLDLPPQRGNPRTSPRAPPALA